MAAFDQYIYICTIILIIANLLFGADDLFIDLYAWIKRLKVKTINQIDFIKMNCADEKPLAIMVASWKEKHVLTRMVQGNSKRVLYSNVHFFLGVYPNDEATLLEAKELASSYPNVHVVINSECGPTSKGQMINEIVYGIFAKEQELKLKFASMIIHDSEDLIHPYSLKLINTLLDNYSFIQIPIFSLPVSPKELVAGIYMDEFAESHLKDLLVRQDMGVAIPSAGVGTALSRQLVEHYLKVQSGMLLNPLTVTEDYELGVKTKRYGFKSTFACYNLENSKDATIATREYFPKKFIRSIRQKSRWVLGITFQGTEFLGWSGSFKERYFLFRDRKGPTANMFVLIGMVAFLYSLVRIQMDSNYTAGFLKFTNDHGISPTLIISLMGVNVLFMVNRLFQRGYFSYVLYGWKTLPFLVARVILGNIINSAASIKACNQYIVSKITGEAPKWIKTEHELPVGFGSDEVDNISRENQTTTA